MPFEAREQDIHQDDIRLLSGSDLQTRQSVFGMPHHFETRNLLQQSDHAFHEDGAISSDDDTCLHHSLGYTNGDRDVQRHSSGALQRIDRCSAGALERACHTLISTPSVLD
ncbi:hypothetical protein FHR65_000055 [Xanthomonas arboricola]|uniref:Uncharacterized protein n=1 Tax=Xanthomonas arboricola TaxID=56448 RepID=A0AB73GSX7_9XANT|nr:hypothetical protein [Xanthomonas arboricola]